MKRAPARVLAIRGGLAILALVRGTDGRVPLEDRPRRLVEIGGLPPVDPDGIVGVSFGTDGRFTVDTGCHSGGGTYHVESNRILLDSEILQPSTCDEAMAAQDAILLTVIEGRPQFVIDIRTGRLRLTGETGEALPFEGPLTRSAYTVAASETAGWSRVGWATSRREESPSSPAQGGG